MKTYIDVINETVAYYSEDVSRRSYFIDENGHNQCLYNGPDGKQCAFARCCNPISSKYEYHNSSHVIKKEGIQILKEEYRHLINDEFWDSLQKLHDVGIYWDEKGLTKYGIYHVEILKEKYK